MRLFKSIISVLGVGSNVTGHGEKFISAIGGFIGISLILWVSHYYLGTQGAALLVASMGASAVLLFAVPHGELSQPWPLMGGNLVSAVIGVFCAQHISYMLIAAPLAVALAIIVMHYLRCIHPPGGATALTAVVGGSQVHELGYQFVLTPVFLNVVIILFVAIAVNYSFPWRRYPAGLKIKSELDGVQKVNVSKQLTHADFTYALKEIGSYVDVNEEDLSKIYHLAAKHAWQISDNAEKITEGLYYSNGEQGDDLIVCRVLGFSTDGSVVTFKKVTGVLRDEAKITTLAEFSQWNQYEVIFKAGGWHRVRQADKDD